MSKSGIAPEILTLPEGGGAITPVGERFEPDLFTGTGQFRIPLWFPKGVRGFKPEMRLLYSTSLGSGAFGFGWRLDLLSIHRQTDRSLPLYDDSKDSFVLGGEELAPLAGGAFLPRTRPFVLTARRAGDGWEVSDRDGNLFRLGDTANARQGEFAWFVREAADPFGNTIRYEYLHDDGQVYLSRITYAAYEVRFEYEARPDARTDCRSGSPITTNLRCRRIEYHLSGEADSLIRSYDLEYDQAAAAGHSLLARVTFSGHRAGETASQPRLQLEYASFSAERPRLRALDSGGGSPPRSLGDPEYALVDIFARGLPDVVQLGQGAGRYWENAGRGRFRPPRNLRHFPAALTLRQPAVAFADMQGNGTADVLDLRDELPVVYPNRPGSAWQAPERVRRPGLALGDPDLRLLDLNGDHISDALKTGQRYFFLYLNRAGEGWEAPQRVRRIHDLAQWPDIFFSDARVKLADMNGDGLVDIVLAQSGRIDYWPYLGHGRWGARVSLDLAPNISRNFDPRRLFLTDLDGDGAADIVYVEADRVRYWINRSGKSLAPMERIRHTPLLGGGSLAAADMDGAGVDGILWTFEPSRLNRNNYKYLDFTRGEKPFLLRRVDNGLGCITEIDYRSSVECFIDDRGSPAEWDTSLPFPVNTIAEIRQRDTTTGNEQRRTFHYHDGLFDGASREFRGFGRVEAIEHGDAEVAGVRTVSFFHQDGELSGKLRRLETYGLDGGPLESIAFRIDESQWSLTQVDTDLNGRPVMFPHLDEGVTRQSERAGAERISRTSYQYNAGGDPSRKEEVFVHEDAGEERIVTTVEYATHPTGAIRGKASTVRIEDGTGALVTLRRFYYDGAAHQGLPLGQVTSGLVSRQEDLVLSPPNIAAAYGASPPDFNALGYHAIALPGGGTGQAANTAGRAYDAQGRLIETSEADGNITQIVYDAAGLQPAEIRMPLGKVNTCSFDYRAQAITRLTDPNGNSTFWRFDPLGRMVALIKPGDSDAFPTVSLEYRNSTLPSSVATSTRLESGQAAVAQSVRYFDAFGRTLQQRTMAEAGQVVVEQQTRRNRRGLVSRSIRPFFSAGLGYVEESGPAEVIYRYDGIGRQTSTELPDGSTTRTEYGLFTITRFDVTDTDASPANIARGHFDTPKTERIDGSGRVTAVTERLAGGVELTTTYEYDAAGRITGITDNRGLPLVSYVYDHLGRKLRMSHADAGDRVFFYRSRGDLAGAIEGNNQLVAYSYDPLSRLTQIAVDGAPVERRFYDSGPGANLELRLARVEDEAGSVAFSYNDRGLVAAKTRTVTTQGGGVSFTVGYAYDARENIATLTWPDGASAAYEYSPRGLLTAIPGFVGNIAYNPLGQVTSLDYANGVRTVHDYELTNSLLRQSRTLRISSGEEYVNHSFDYDAIGNPLSITDGAASPGHQHFSRRYEYDALHRLTAAEGDIGAAPFAHEYAYDAAGNFTRNTEFGAAAVTLAAGGGNRIETAGAAAFTYDAAGNVATMPGAALSFDPRSRLTSVLKSDGTNVEYRYSFEGERVVRRVVSAAGPRESIYIDGLYEWHDGVTTRHVIDGSRRYAVVQGGVTRFLHTDNLGSSIAITASDGSLLFQAGYFAFGSAAFRAAGDDYLQRYLQQYLDEETGLYYFHARWFAPGLGRFISPDAAVLGSPDNFLANPQGLNPYAYALNNPVRLVDVNGNWWKWIVGALIIVALVVLTVVTYGGASALWAAGAAYFGFFAAAATGAVLGAAVGVTYAAASGQDLADGFLFGALIGAAAGAAGYWAGTAVAGAIGGPWGLILGQAVQGAIVGFGDGLIQGIASGQGALEVLGSAALGAVIGFAVGFAVQGLGQLTQNSSCSAIRWIGSTFLYTGPAATDRWWFYWSYLLRPIPKAWAFEKVSNWLSSEDTSTSTSGLTSYDSVTAGLSSPQAYVTATPLHSGSFFVSVDEFLSGALNTFITDSRRDVEAALA